ncbi:MAG: AraC family transcriptional regulator ligand-binding domain-containing protein [Sandaracinaceae bacterium]|nr:AraC family transcriptional regulator ligand-binding domain-containing protein [Sandaracinaceae bacterium]
MSAKGGDDWARWFVPGVYTMTLLEIAADRGHRAADLLARAGLAMQPREILESGVTLEEQRRLVAVVREVVDDPALGVEFGWRLPPTALGSVGYAILSSASGRDALDIVRRFWPLVGRALAISIHEDDDTTFAELVASIPMSEDQRRMTTEVALVTLTRGVLALVPEAEGQTEVWFDYAEPRHAARVRERLGLVRYDMPSTCFRAPTALLDRPLAMSNPAGLRAAVTWCEREAEERGLTEQRTAIRVQAELRLGREGYPSLDDVAKRLRTSPRTLRRQLEREGTRFSTLLEDARRRDALRLLDNPALSAARVAAMLGYEDPANFTRAFRRWTGRTPTRYRQERSADR